MSTGTLFGALQGIRDHRTKKGQRFPLAAILAIAIAAMLSGANDLKAIPAFAGTSLSLGAAAEPESATGARSCPKTQTSPVPCDLSLCFQVDFY
jgi:hypothetical protein